MSITIERDGLEIPYDYELGAFFIGELILRTHYDEVIANWDLCHKSLDGRGWLRMISFYYIKGELEEGFTLDFFGYDKLKDTFYLCAEQESPQEISFFDFEGKLVRVLLETD